MYRTLAVATLIACKPPAPPWTASVVLSPAPEVVHVEEAGKRCFDVVIYATPAEVTTITAALHEVCVALRDPVLTQHLTATDGLLSADDHKSVTRDGLGANLEPTTLGNPGAWNGHGVSFYVVASSTIASSGISEICVDRNSSVRALAVSRKDRLMPSAPGKEHEAMARLVNTIAHETMHLRSKTSEEQCIDRFDDNDSNLKKCHDFTYAVGNSAACSYLARTDGTDWQACMVQQAALTPGFQHPERAKDELGCDR